MVSHYHQVSYTLKKREEDVFVPLSNAIVRLQQQINVLRDMAKRFNLVVSTEKSQIVIFRNGGEKRFYDGMELQHVNHYKHSGIILSTGLTFSCTHKDMPDIQERCEGILRLLWSLGKQCPKIFFKLFDYQIQPTL